MQFESFDWLSYHGHEALYHDRRDFLGLFIFIVV